MNRALVLVLALVAGFAHAAGKPVVRVVIDGKQPVLVGQQIKVNVQVLVPNFFMSAPKWPQLDIPGAVVTLSGDTTHLNETIGGESYAGIQQTYLIVPQQAGEFTLPPAKITFQYAAEPGKPTPGTLMIPPQKFTARLPAGAQSAGVIAPVAKVTLTQTLDREPKGLRAGDALVRTVTAYAANTRAMMIPPPSFDAPRGVRVYPHDPALSDVTNERGGFVGGRRVDHVTYVFEEAGSYTLPAIETSWFNPATGKQEAARAPEINVSVAANPGFKQAIVPEAPVTNDASAPPEKLHLEWRRWLPLAAGLIALALVLAWLLRRYGPRLQHWLAGRRAAREEGEPASFARVEQACRANDPLAAYRALGAWARRAGAGSIASWSAEAETSELRHEIEVLERSLFAAQDAATGWSGHGLAAACVTERKTWLARQGRMAKPQSALPALNP
jgi:hypothetical protein